ncbi:hypothetical protein C8R47DRAFT_1086889 [Mycena vitilis]|nr:hypothetical protein C8R47DRAFT_1086889 [Mycena vitilis]
MIRDNHRRKRQPLLHHDCIPRRRACYPNSSALLAGKRKPVYLPHSRFCLGAWLIDGYDSEQRQPLHKTPRHSLGTYPSTNCQATTYIGLILGNVEHARPRSVFRHLLAYTPRSRTIIMDFSLSLSQRAGIYRILTRHCEQQAIQVRASVLGSGWPRIYERIGRRRDARRGGATSSAIYSRGRGGNRIDTSSQLLDTPCRPRHRPASQSCACIPPTSERMLPFTHPMPQPLAWSDCSHINTHLGLSTHPHS